MSGRKRILKKGILVLIGATIVSFYASSNAAAESKYLQEEEYFEARKTGRYSLNSQVSVFSGDYGATNNKNTTLTYFRETLKYTGDIGEISLGVPYVIRNGGVVTAGESVAASTGALPKRADGLGDITLKGRYYWIEETDYMPAFDLTGKVKIPTASHDRGLGTGKLDVGAGMSLLKNFGNFVALGDLEVLERRRPSNSTIKKTRLDYSLGAGYRFTETFSSYLFVEGSSKPSSDSKKPLEILLSGVYRPNSNYSFNGYFLVGLTDGSPDAGGSLGFTRYF